MAEKTRKPMMLRSGLAGASSKHIASQSITPSHRGNQQLDADPAPEGGKRSVKRFTPLAKNDGKTLSRR
jgi:hypothetical protein